MNSPFVTEQAKALAARPEVADAKTPDGEGDGALPRRARPRADDGRSCARRRSSSADDDAKAAFGRWEQLAQVLLLSNEFAFVD